MDRTEIERRHAVLHGMLVSMLTGDAEALPESPYDHLFKGYDYTDDGVNVHFTDGFSFALKVETICKPGMYAPSIHVVGDMELMH